MDWRTIISGLNFPESPSFDFNGNLWFAEINGGNLARWDGKRLTRFDVDGTPNGIAIDEKGCIWFCDSRRGEIRMFDPLYLSFQTICCRNIEGERLSRPNDLIFDVKGNLLFSDHADGREKPLSTICVLPRGEKMAKTISDKKYFTNGLALMPDNKTLIFSETYRQQLWVAWWDYKKLELLNERHFAKAGKGPWGPDGLAIDSNEDLFAAVFNEGMIAVYKKNGELTDVLQCPGTRPTSCAFDPSGKLGLVVTEAERGEIISCPEAGSGLPIYYQRYKNLVP